MNEKIKKLIEKGVIFHKITDNTGNGFYKDRNRGYSYTLLDVNPDKYKKGMLILVEYDKNNKYYLFLNSKKSKSDSNNRKIIFSKKYKEINFDLISYIKTLDNNAIQQFDQKYENDISILSKNLSLSIFTKLCAEDPSIEKWIQDNTSNKISEDKLTDITISDIVKFADMENYTEHKEGNIHKLKEDYIIIEAASTFLPEEFTNPQIQQGGYCYLYKKPEESSDLGLMIYVANRQLAEELLGTDIIYINNIRKNIVMAQYKMLNQEGNDWVSRDRSLHKQIEKMQKFSTIIGRNTSEKEYRLSSEIFFIRFIKNQIINNNIQSYIIPLGLYKFKYKNNEFSGRSGGYIVSHNSLKKQSLGIRELEELIKNGFIGTYETNFEDIKKLIINLFKNNKKNKLVIAYKTAIENI